MKEKKYIKNKFWENANNPYFTIITPIYNRAYCIERVFNSVKKQTFKDFEYIIIDDGSTDNIDEKVENFMNNTDIPILYIKKENGGVHTARNAGIQNGRGKLVIFLDSDDELTPDSLELSYNEWNRIPKTERNDYFQMKALCITQNGNQIGKDFPNNINELNWKKRVKVARSYKVDHSGVRQLKIMKENPWPEPKYVKFVIENVLWAKLDKKYKSWYFNDKLKIVHIDNEDHISNCNKSVVQKWGLQTCINNYWQITYYLNNKKIYINNLKHYIKLLMEYALLRNYLKDKKVEVTKCYKIKNFIDEIFYIMFYIPSILAQKWFEKKYIN